MQKGKELNEVESSWHTEGEKHDRWIKGWEIYL